MSVYVAARRAAYRGIVPDEVLARTVEDWLPEWETVLDDAPEATLLCATQDGAVVGFTWFGPARDVDQPDEGEVYLVYVAPEESGDGVGSALLARAVEALAHDFDEIVLWTLQANARARGIYHRHGWRLDDGRKLSPFGTARLPEVRYRAPRPATR